MFLFAVTGILCKKDTVYKHKIYYFVFSLCSGEPMCRVKALSPPLKKITSSQASSRYLEVPNCHALQ